MVIVKVLISNARVASSGLFVSFARKTRKRDGAGQVALPERHASINSTPPSSVDAYFEETGRTVTPCLHNRHAQRGKIRRNESMDAVTLEIPVFRN